MALVTTKEMFKKAYEGGYAIGAFPPACWAGRYSTWRCLTCAWRC